MYIDLNSSLGAPCALVENFGEQQTPSLVLSPKFSTNTKLPPQILELDSNSNATESSLRGRIADSSKQSKQNNLHEVQTESRPIRGAKNRIQSCSSATADFLLESELRGSPPKSEKAAAFWRVGGAGRGVQPFLRKEKGDSKGKKIVSDSRIAKMDSSLTVFAKNDEFMDCFGDKLSRNGDNAVDCHDFATQNLAMTGKGDSSLRGESMDSPKQSTNQKIDCFGQSPRNDRV